VTGCAFPPCPSGVGKALRSLAAAPVKLQAAPEASGVAVGRGLRFGVPAALVAAALAISFYLSTQGRVEPPVDPPQRIESDGTNRVAGRLDEFHQCYISGSVNGVPYTFLADSGAAVLSFNQAHVRRIGIDPLRLRYDQETSTANGTGHAAAIRLNELRLGGFVMRGVPAWVDQAGAPSPLLGMGVLKNMVLKIGNGTCSLTW